MSAEVLRQAAALMRERAAAATAGPWVVPESIHGDPFITELGRGILRGGGIALADRRDDYGRSNAAHIASWHPAVASAVANWLDSEAEQVDLAEADGYEIGSHFPGLVVARAYLGMIP